MFKRTLATTLLAAAALFPSSSLLANGYVIIANPNIDLEQVDLNSLRDIYLGKIKRWDDGSTVQPVYVTRGDAHKEFLSEVVNKTPAQFRTYWKRAVFTGGRAGFKKVGSEEELVEYIRDNEGAVGYISADFEAEGVKVIGVQR